MENEQKVNSYALASFILGIIGIILLKAWIIGMIAVAAGEKFRRLNKVAEGKLRGKAFALIGTILGIIPFLLLVIVVVIKSLTGNL